MTERLWGSCAFSLTVGVGLLTAAVEPARGDEWSELLAKATAGDPAAQCDVARRYASGQGVEKDDRAALEWYQKAAARDYAPALVSLGSIYSHGFGVQQDWAESIRWFRQGALQGDRVSQHNLGLDYQHGHGVERDASAAARWFRLGAEQGQPRCQFNLGQLYESGTGVAPSRFEAYVLYARAAEHENQLHIFGEAKARELIERRDRLAELLTPAELAAAHEQLAAWTAREGVHPRRFGSASGNIGTTRGWYLWRSFNPRTWEAEVSPDRPLNPGEPETWKVRVLPWVTTYRYLAYGSRPERLLPGERVNIFFNPDERHRRGYLVHYQDEICQMKGHGHSWQIVSATGNRFSARAMAGEQRLEEEPRAFQFDPECQVWSKGTRQEQPAIEAGDRVYMTWCQQAGERIVRLICDDASLPSLQQLEMARVDEETSTWGLAGRIESIDGPRVHLLIFSNHWKQIQGFPVGTRVGVAAAGSEYRPQGTTTAGTITFRKNRGTYGSGVTDLIVEMASADDAPQWRALWERPVVRLLRGQP